VTLAQLRYLVAIIDANLNITLAAERVHATQPGLSKQLKQLEEELGLQIFVRKGKSLAQVTPAGAQVIARARVMLSEAANIRTLAAEHRQAATGELVIATTQTQARFVLPHALRRLKADYPAVNVRFDLFSDAEGARRARADADLLIASAAERPVTDDLVVPLYRWRRLALLPPGHPLADSRRPVTLAELARYPLIGYESALGSHDAVTEAFKAAGHPAQFAYAAHDTEVVKTFVRSGLGVGLIAEMALADEDADLIRRPVEGLDACTAFAILPRDRIVRNFVVGFLAALAPHLEPREITRALRSGASHSQATAPLWTERAALLDERSVAA
jgi:LysR family transcriptional regulator, cys regulon transcriptional activator